MPEQRGADVIQVNLRLMRLLHKRLAREAKRNKRSLNDEMKSRLTHSFERDEADDKLQEAEDMLDRAKATLEKAEEIKERVWLKLFNGNLDVEDIWESELGRVPLKRTPKK